MTKNRCNGPVFDHTYYVACDKGSLKKKNVCYNLIILEYLIILALLRILVDNYSSSVLTLINRRINRVSLISSNLALVA